MLCPKCGFYSEKEENVCPECGNILRQASDFRQRGAQAIRQGAIPLYDIAPECAYMKLLLACAQEQMSVRRFMEET